MGDEVEEVGKKRQTGRQGQDALKNSEHMGNKWNSASKVGSHGEVSAFY